MVSDAMLRVGFLFTLRAWRARGPGRLDRLVDLGAFEDGLRASWQDRLLTWYKGTGGKTAGATAA